jgi:hypothetical protein
METSLSEQDRRECESALAYISDMAAWHEDEAGEGSKLDFALRILDQIDRRGRLTAAMRAWCETRIRAEYGG